MLRKVRMWCGKTPYNVTGRLIRDTGTGLIIEDTRGVRFFAPSRDVLEHEATVIGNLFAPIS